MSEHSDEFAPFTEGEPRHRQGDTCPRCGAARTSDGFCSPCFLRGLPR